MRHTKREVAQALLAQSPPGWSDTRTEKAASRKSGLRGRDRKHEEDDLQVSICKMLKLLPGTLYWHTPSSFYRGPNSGNGFYAYISKLKAKGWYAGIPDLCVVFRNIHGATSIVFAELKKPKGGVTTDEQESFLDKANGIGCYTAKVSSIISMNTLLKVAGHPALGLQVVTPADFYVY